MTVHLDLAPIVRRRREFAIGVAALAVACVALIPDIAASGPLSRRTPMVALGAPRFVEETSSAGLDHVYKEGFEYAVGGGVAAFDCNGDERSDLYLAGGSDPAALYRNDSPVGGALHFTRIRDSATDVAGANGAYPIDIDGDGMTDLVVLRNGENVLLRGLGGCRFERANERWGFSLPTSATTAFSATWEAAATLPTLAFGNYVDPASNDPHHLCFDNVLLRPAGTAATYAQPIPLTPSWCALSMLFSDWSRSGRMDLRVSNDEHYYLPTEGEEQLWRIAGGQPPSLFTADEGWVRVQVQGMGIASYDLTGDGYPEVFLTSQADNRLQTLTAGPSQPTYRDIGERRGVNAAQPFTGGDTRPSTAWHDEFADVNNDGFVDLFIAKGNVTNQIEYAQKDPSNLLLGQRDGTFREAADAAGIVTFDRGRGAALADFNLDGMLDLVQVNYGAPVRLWRNVGAGDASRPRAMGNWLALSVVQPGPNANAIGAWVELRVGDRITRRELTIGGGHAGGRLGWVHFGLGDAAGADVRVLWPGGETGSWLHVAANEFAVVQRGVAETRRWSPAGS
ncbi:MAG: CRTAC1 family protein [Chloroflexota bacterium]|nr:CRTAC1 family protein [Chloroflexota bacterium]